MKVLKLVPEKEQRTIWFAITIFTYLIIAIPLSIPFIITGNFTALMPLVFILAITTIAFVLVMIWIPFFFNSLKYEIDANEIRMSKGVFWRSRITVPYPKITNVDVTQGPIERMAGIGKIKVQTAGYSGNSEKAEMALLGVLEFEKIKDLIMGYVRQGSKPFADIVKDMDDLDTLGPDSLGEILTEIRKIREILENRPY